MRGNGSHSHAYSWVRSRSPIMLSILLRACRHVYTAHAHLFVDYTCAIGLVPRPSELSNFFACFTLRACGGRPGNEATCAMYVVFLIIVNDRPNIRSDKVDFCITTRLSTNLPLQLSSVDVT